MQIFKVASLSALLALVPVQAMAAKSPKSPAKMSSSEITENNKGLDPSDPAFIKCRRNPETGSLIGKKKTCRSNAQWDAMADFGQSRDAGHGRRNGPLRRLQRQLMRQAGWITSPPSPSSTFTASRL